MEPHPVPQQIMDVDFKLFGSFSLKQFIRIVIGCALGFIIFLIEPIPGIIRVILIGCSVIGGFFFAIIPRFEVWVFNFIKAVFISPRYIWIREYRTPEILTTSFESTGEKTTQITSVKNSKKIDIDDLPLERMFGKRDTGGVVANTTYDPLDTVTVSNSDNFEKQYGKIFKNTRPASKKPQLVNRPSARPIAQNAFKPSFKSFEEYESVIKKLKFELSKVVHDPNLKDKENELMMKISNLYQEVKLIKSMGVVNQNPVQVVTQGSNTKIKPIDNNGKIIFGIVVDKKDVPVPNALVKFKSMSSDFIYQTQCQSSGKFSTEKQLPMGEYEVSIESESKKFHTYKIIVADKNLPGYKLREK